MTFWIESFATKIEGAGTNFDSGPSRLGRPALKDGELESGLEYLY